jgi:hypothetical protein
MRIAHGFCAWPKKLAPMRTNTLWWSSKFTRIYKIVLSPFTIFIKFVSDHSLYEKPAVYASFGLLWLSTGSDQVQNLHAALTFCFLHFPNLVFSSKANPKLNTIAYRLVEVFLTPMLALLTSTPVGLSSDWLTNALVELLLQPMLVWLKSTLIGTSSG